jgi:hypothetical protein
MLTRGPLFFSRNFYFHIWVILSVNEIAFQKIAYICMQGMMNEPKSIGSPERVGGCFVAERSGLMVVHGFKNVSKKTSSLVKRMEK